MQNMQKPVLGLRSRVVAMVCFQYVCMYVDEFLKSKKLVPLQPITGNRLNIFFSNAGHVYFLRHKMHELLEESSSLNSLLETVLKDLKAPFFSTICKALG